MKNEIEGRLEEDKAKTPTTLEFKGEPLNYTYISDIRDIVLKKDNWSECFGVLFKRNEQLRDQFRTRMDEIQDVRDKVKHAHKVGESFTCTEPQVQRVLQNMLWILAFFNQYKEVMDILDQSKSINIETRDESKIVSLGRICCTISKRDAEEFDRKVKELAGKAVYKAGGDIVLKLESSEEKFNMPKKKLILILALCRKNGIASISRRSFNEYKIHFRTGNSMIENEIQA